MLLDKAVSKQALQRMLGVVDGMLALAASGGRLKAMACWSKVFEL